MMRSLKIRGRLKNAHPATRRNKPCQKDKNIKNIERPIIADLKTDFYQGVFYGFSK
ncbi:hypothetical protein [Helicobacter pylori]|uniref:hypothetical protein n=1 Tax=Helicobacter pylori TaxID=210 RepID=UPI001603D59E|nr:hypothetical protein [Helicobacter pylori]